MTPAKTLLDDCSKAFKSARSSIYEGAALLYQIEQNEAWQGVYGSLTEYIEQECQISRPFALKLLQVWKYYVIEGKCSPRTLSDIDTEKLYLATKLPSGSPETRMVKAREWNRDDFRTELSTRDGIECQHPEDKQVILCGTCGKRVG